MKAVASGGHGHTEDELRYVRCRYLSAEAARAIAVQIANATFAARSAELWARTRPRSPPTPRMCAPTTRTCSLSGTRATAAVGCSSTGTWRRSPWPSTPS
ncbi:hypothetical protein ABT356_46465 [Streptosporangium roseum]